jgi:hypothetical protein
MSIDHSISDLEAAYAAIASGKPLDPEVKKRVHERAEKVREEIRRKHGVLNVAVDLIREVRDE